MAQNITPTAAEVEVNAVNPAGVLYLRYRAGTSGDWTETDARRVTSSPARFTIAGLTNGTQYQGQASFDENFSTGVLSESFTTPVLSVTGVEVASWAGYHDWYRFGNVISIRVTFSEAVVVTGSPTLGIDMDPADWGRKDAVYASGSGTTELTFTHKVAWPNYSTQGIAVLADTLALNGGTIRGAASGADADPAHNGLDHDPAHKVDWQPSQTADEVAMTVICAAAQGVDAESLQWTVPEPPTNALGNPVIVSRMIAGSLLGDQPAQCEGVVVVVESGCRAFRDQRRRDAELCRVGA